jgi:hypothetical protein
MVLYLFLFIFHIDVCSMVLVNCDVQHSTMWCKSHISSVGFTMMGSFRSLLGVLILWCCIYFEWLAYIRIFKFIATYDIIYWISDMHTWVIIFVTTKWLNSICHFYFSTVLYVFLDSYSFFLLIPFFLSISPHLYISMHHVQLCQIKIMIFSFHIGT